MRGRTMLKVMCLICICFVTLPVFCESAAKYEVATITDVKRHLASDDKVSDAVSYEVSVRVADTSYLVLYTDTLGTNAVKYAAGRELLVHVGKNTITYNDILGRSQEVPIISQRPVTNTKQSK
jgi:hypothetical protein